MFLGQDGNQLTMLILVLAVVFVFFKFIFVIYNVTEMNVDNYYTDVHEIFTLPASLNQLLFKPWTILTYMFMHFDVWHMIGNLIWLWLFGYIMQDLAGNDKIFTLFIYGGLAGAFFFLLSFNLLPKFAGSVNHTTLQGASAGVMAVALAATTLAPKYRLLTMLNGGIPLWVITVIFVIVDFASIGSANSGGHIAHLAGAAMGFVFSKQLNKGNDWSAWFNRLIFWITNIFNPDKKKPVIKNKKEEIFYKSKGTPYTKTPQISQQRIDAILDKINQNGVEVLTEEEIDILRRAGEE